MEDQPISSLAQLHSTLVVQLGAAHVGFEAGPFRAHITLGRSRRDATSAQSEDMFNAIAHRAGLAGKDRAVEAAACNEVTLMQSDLRPTGPIYTALHRARLGGTP